MENMSSDQGLNSQKTKRSKVCYLLGIILFGQVTCFTFSSFGALNKVLDGYGLAIPLTTIFFSNLMNLSLFLCECGRIPQQIKPPQFYFFLCALFDISAFVLSMFAYQYTTIANNDLMQVFGIFVAAILSMIVFKLKYHWLHYLGMLFGVVGILTTVWTDLFSPDQSYSSSYLLGDLFAILASALYACEIVIQEKLMNEGISPFAYLANIAKYSSVLAIILFCATLQFKDYEQYKGNWIYLLYEIPLVLVGFVNSLTTVFFIRLNGATAYSIIALCGVLYSMLFDIFLFNSPFRYLVIIGYVIIVIGVVMFHLKEPRKPQEQHQQLMESNLQEVRALPSNSRQFDQ